MEHREFEAPERLKDTIKCFWHNRREVDIQQSTFEVVPDGYAEIIFYFGSLSRATESNELESLPSPFIMGLLNKPIVFYTKERLDVIGVRCFPWTVFDLLGLPSGKDGLRLLDHPINKLQSTLDQLVGEDKIEEAMLHVKEYFLSARSDVPVNSMLSKAGIAMQKANGTIPVSQVAEAAHATVRTLERNFKGSSGFTVKDVSALMRFEQVRNQLWNDPNTNIAGLAHELGYTDQSHLSREFKKFSGTTPAAFARKASKTTGSDFVAFVQA